MEVENRNNAIQVINDAIKKAKDKGLISTKDISDTHHTFGQLYEQRAILFISLCNAYPKLAWKSKRHFDEENDPMFEGDFIAGIKTPLGQATYHIKLDYWNMLNVVELPNAPQYDKYSSEDVLKRLLSLNQ